MPILKLDKHDPQRELEFEVECALMVTPEERLEKWLEWNTEMLKWIEAIHGPDNGPRIEKRDCISK